MLGMGEACAIYFLSPGEEAKARLRAYLCLIIKHFWGVAWLKLILVTRMFGIVCFSFLNKAQRIFQGQLKG